MTTPLFMPEIRTRKEAHGGSLPWQEREKVLLAVLGVFERA